MASESYILSNFWKKLQDAPTWDTPVAMNRNLALPLDKYSVFDALSSAREYAENNPIAYPGQIITVVDNATSAISTYKIKVGGALKQIDDIDYQNLINLSTGLSTEIQRLSASLSGYIDKLSAGLSTEIGRLSTGLSTEIGRLSAGLSGSIDKLSAGLSTAISSKVYFKGDEFSGYGDLSVVKIDKATYDELVVNENVDPQTIYIVSSNYIDAYGEKIKNLADGSEVSDAVNYGQLTSLVDKVSVDLDELASKRIFVRNYDVSGNELTAFTNLSVVKMKFDDYADLVESGEIYNLSNVVFVISSDNLDAYGEKITNVKAGTEPTDAVNYSQLTNVVAGDIASLCVGLSTEIQKLSTGLSTEIGKLSTGLSTEIGKLSVGLSTAISSKVYFKNNEFSGHGDLSVIKISKDEYDNLVLISALNPHAIYIVSSDYIDAYGKQMKNLAEATDISDAVTYKQLTTLSTEIKTEIGNVSSGLDGELKKLSVALSGYIDKLSVGLSTEIDNLSVGLSTEIQNLSTGLSTEIGKLSTGLSTAISSKVYFKGDEFTGYGDLSVVKISKAAYDELVINENVDPQTIYIVSSNYIDAYGEKMKNLAEGTEDSDAINYSQLKSLSIALSTSIQNTQCSVQVAYQLSDINDGINTGDIAIVSTRIGISEPPRYQVTGYVWRKELSSWAAMDGNYSAKNVFIEDDISCAGTYDRIGNIVMNSQGQSLSCAGKSIQKFFEEIFDKEDQPSLGANPTATCRFTNSSLNVEVGTQITPSYTVTFTQGKYNYPWLSGSTKTVDDGTSPLTFNVVGSHGDSKTTQSGSLSSFYINDNETYKISATVSYSDGFVAKTNKGNDSSPLVQRQASTLSPVASTNSFTSFRYSFKYHGEELTLEQISSQIRSNPFQKVQVDMSPILTVDDGDMFVAYALPDKNNVRTLNSAIDQSNNLDVTGIFEKSSLSVTGDNGQYPLNYSIFCAKASGYAGFSATTIKMTIS